MVSRQDIPEKEGPLDVLIIGAGPCGLAQAARLQESTPSALFTDEEHRRYHWIRRHGGRVALAGKKTGHGHACPNSKPRIPEANRSPNILILDDSSPSWLEKWHRSFRTLEIGHLRSPMFFHVDPGDRDGMLASTRENHREGELGEISGCVGKEISKRRKKGRERTGRKRDAIGDEGVEIDERDRKDYFSPSSALFADYSDSIVRRYGLDLPGLLLKREVVDIQYGDDGDSGLKVFTVRTGNGEEFYARAVVLAIGPGKTKIYPFPLSDEERMGACHSSEIGRFPSLNVQRKIGQHRESNVVVVGGGLTSAQIVDLAARGGVSKVWYLMRSDVKGKPVIQSRS